MPPPDNTRSAAKGGARPAQDASSSSEAALQECEALEAEIAELRHTYEQYFLGMERQAPIRAHEDLKKRMMRLKGAFVRSTSVKFRVQSLHNKFLTYERLWMRTIQEIEAGTYHRDLAKARRRSVGPKQPEASGERRKDVVELPEEISDMEIEEIEELTGRRPLNEPKVPARPVNEPAVAPAPGTPFRGPPAVAGATKLPSLTPAVPAVAVGGTPAAGRPAVPPGMAASKSAAPGVPAVAAARPAAAAPSAPRPAAAGPGGGMSDDKLRAVYDAYVTAKRRCQEDTSKLSYESVAATLRKQVPELLKQHNAKAVEFKVVIKDGKASLKAVPK